MAVKEDLRITKTKAALTGSFFKMLEDKPLEDITVNELCDIAGVRRATFYKHFNDKNDFLMYLIKDVRERFENDVWSKQSSTYPTKDYYVNYAKALTMYLLEKQIPIKKIIKSSVRSTFIEVFAHQNQINTKNRLEASVAAGMELVSSPTVVASMLVGGITQCIINWFDTENKCCSVEDLLNEISKIIEKVLS